MNKLSEFHLSCLNGDIEKVKELLNNNNINEIIKINEERILIESKELTSIICAIRNNHLSIVKYFYQQGIDIYLLQ